MYKICNKTAFLFKFNNLFSFHVSSLPETFYIDGGKMIDMFTWLKNELQAFLS